MSKHHHDKAYYDMIVRNTPKCITPYCEGRPEQLHHMSLIASQKHSGTIPRRHSSYQVVPVCQKCHDRLHSRDGERQWLLFFPGGRLTIMKAIEAALATYGATLGQPEPPEMPRETERDQEVALRWWHEWLTGKVKK